MSHLPNCAWTRFVLNGWRCQRNFRILLLLLLLSVELHSASAQMETAPSGWVEGSGSTYNPSETHATRAEGAGGKNANLSDSIGIGPRPYLGPQSYVDPRFKQRPLRYDIKPISLNPPKKRGHKPRHPTITSNSDRLAALPPGLRVGTIFDKNSLHSGLDNLDWFKIPSWMAGRWMRTKQAVMWMENYVTGEERNEPSTIPKIEYADLGAQYDNQHNIWNACLVKSTVEETYDGILRVRLVRTQEPRVVSNQKVVLRDVYVGLKVNKETNIITECQQVETITTYVPINENTMTTTMSVEIFGEEGLPIRLQENVALDRRVSPFAPIDSFNGADIKNSFLDFLKSKGLSDMK